MNSAKIVEFQPARRDRTNLLIGLAGASGTGKTFSALRLARGLVGEAGRIALIDTEGGRAKHYADLFRFDHADMEPPYTPERLADAAIAAQAAGYDALVIDSASDEYEGIGGLQDMHDAALLRLARKDSLEDVEQWQWDKLNAPAWNIPKQAHKRKLMSRLRAMRMYLLFCLRAEEKIEFVEVEDDQGRKRTKIRPAGWVPICEKRFMYDMTVSMTFSPEQPGVPLMKDGKAVYGKIPDHLLFGFPEGQRISEETGRALAHWAGGGSQPQRQAQPGRKATFAERMFAKAEEGEEALSDILPALNEAQRAWTTQHWQELLERAHAADERRQAGDDLEADIPALEAAE